MAEIIKFPHPDKSARRAYDLKVKQEVAEIKFRLTMAIIEDIMRNGG